MDPITGVIEAVAGSNVDGDPNAFSLDGWDMLLAGGSLVFADGRRIVRFDLTTGAFSDVANAANLGSSSGDGGPALDAGVGTVRGYHLDAANNLLLVDTSSRTLRKIDNFPSVTATANAGDNQSIQAVASAGTEVTLSAIGSYASTGGTQLSVLWEFVERPDGSEAVLIDATSAQPRFVPDADGDYTVRLTVTDELGSTATDEVLVAVELDDAPTANIAGELAVHAGSLVELDGGASSDDLTPSADLAYSWQLTSVPANSAAALSSAADQMVSFTADLAGLYEVELTVEDAAGQTASTSITVTAELPNAKPAADAGADATIAVHVTQTLDGTASSDPDADPLSYSWTILSTPAGSMIDPQLGSVAMPTFTADLAGEYVIGLVVNDGIEDSDRATVTITAVDQGAFALMKLCDADATIAAEPNASFYSGSGSSHRQNRRARISKFWLRMRLRVAAWKVRLLDWSIACGSNPSTIASRQRSALRAIRKVIRLTDGVALRGTADSYGSGFRRDLLVEPTAAQAVYDSLEQARAAVDAVQ